MTDRRERLPNRRGAEGLEFECQGMRYTATLGYYHDGRLAEIFLRCGKSGTDANIAMMEAAIAVSFALQHGCTVETMRAAFPRTSRGEPEGPLGTLLDTLASEPVA